MQSPCTSLFGCVWLTSATRLPLSYTVRPFVLYPVSPANYVGTEDIRQVVLRRCCTVGKRGELHRPCVALATSSNRHTLTPSVVPHRPWIVVSRARRAANSQSEGPDAISAQQFLTRPAVKRIAFRGQADITGSSLSTVVSTTTQTNRFTGRLWPLHIIPSKREYSASLDIDIVHGNGAFLGLGGIALKNEDL